MAFILSPSSTRPLCRPVCLPRLPDRLSESTGHHTQPSPNAKPNFMPVYTDAPVFVKSVENAQLYTVGSGDDTISVVHVWGMFKRACVA